MQLMTQLSWAAGVVRRPLQPQLVQKNIWPIEKCLFLPSSRRHNQNHKTNKMKSPSHGLSEASVNRQYSSECHVRLWVHIIGQNKCKALSLHLTSYSNSFPSLLFSTLKHKTKHFRSPDRQKTCHARPNALHWVTHKQSKNFHLIEAKSTLSCLKPPLWIRSLLFLFLYRCTEIQSQMLLNAHASDSASLATLPILHFFPYGSDSWAYL